MDETEFVSDWRMRLTSKVAGLRLADVTHPLEVFTGSNDLGSPKVVLQSSQKPKLPRLSQLVLVDRVEGSSGYWQLTLTLQDQRFTEVFLRLVADVYGRSKDAPSESTALTEVDHVFDEWRRLLSPRPQGVLSKEELRGLVGELWLLVHRFTESSGIEGAIDGWLGPLGAHQDFAYPTSGLHEAKSIGPTTSELRISSEFQLDPLDSPLEVVVLRLADVPEDSPASVSLPSLVAEVETLLDAEAVGHEELHLRLDHLGVEHEHPFYADQWFTVTTVSTYTAGAEFPAVRASELTPGVRGVFYRVALDAIEPFRTSHVSMD